MTITLNIVGRSVSPRAVSRTLGGEPHESGLMGDPLPDDGTGPIRHARSGFWRRRAQVEGNHHPDDGIRQLLEGLTEDEARWRSITSVFGSTITVVGADPDATPATLFSAEVLSLFHERLITVVVQNDRQSLEEDGLIDTPMNPKQCDAEDPFQLTRFVAAQHSVYQNALAELRNGQKETHWMWFIFPQLAGLGHSAMAQKYAIRTLDEAKAYLNHPMLGPRLIDCCRALLAIRGQSAWDIMGSPDDMKLKSSMTLFSLIPGTKPEFSAVLDQYFGGEQDKRTLELLAG